MIKIELPCANIELLESDLVLIVYKDEYQVELKDVQEVDAAFLEIAGDDMLYAIMDTQGKYNMFTAEAQSYLSKETELVKREQLGGFAILIDTLPYRIMVKVYLKLYKPNYKLQIFSNIKNAKKWLALLKEKSKLSDNG